MSKNVSKMSKEELVEYVKNLFTGCWDGDDHSPLDKFADDAEFIDVTRPVKKVFKGKAEIAKFLEAYGGMSDWKLEVLHAAADGNRVGIEWIWKSLHDIGLYDGIPPRGIRTTIMGSSWITVNEQGKITQQKDIWDKATLVSQLCSNDK